MSRLHWLLLLLTLMPELALLGFFTVGFVLSAPASLPHHADAVVVLGGGSGEGGRYARGRELVLAGFSDRLVLIQPNSDDLKDALEHFKAVTIWDDISPGNSWGEAQVTREQMEANGWHSVLVVSDPPHMLRLSYCWSSQLRGSNLSYTLVASSPPWWSAWHWWGNKSSSDFVGNEVLKLGYYVVRYRLGLF